MPRSEEYNKTSTMWPAKHSGSSDRTCVSVTTGHYGVGKSKNVSSHAEIQTEPDRTGPTHRPFKGPKRDGVLKH